MNGCLTTWRALSIYSGEHLNQSEARRHRSAPSERGLSKAIGVLDKLRNERGEYAAANALR